MSTDAIRAFVEKSEGFIVERMSVCLWRAMGRRLSAAAAADYGAVGTQYRRRFDPDESKPRDGIVALLTRTHRRNVADANVVSITASAT